MRRSGSREAASPASAASTPSVSSPLTQMPPLLDGENDETIKYEVLACRTCECAVCGVGDIMKDRTEVWSRAVYAYELDILSKEDVACYSATNPSEARFDVARINPVAMPLKRKRVEVPRGFVFAAPSQTDVADGGSELPRVAMNPPAAALPAASPVVGRSIILEGAFSAEHSWFPSYSWCFAKCGKCGEHLGWGFAKDAEIEAAVTSTKIAEVVYNRAHVWPAVEALVSAAQNKSVADVVRENSGVLLEHLPPLPAPIEFPVAFIGLIVTKTRERNWTRAEIAASKVPYDMTRRQRVGLRILLEQLLGGELDDPTLLGLVDGGGSESDEASPATATTTTTATDNDEEYETVSEGDDETVGDDEATAGAGPGESPATPHASPVEAAARPAPAAAAAAAAAAAESEEATPAEEAATAVPSPPTPW